MKLECSQSKLKEAVALTEKVTGKNVSLPILTTILFEVKKDRITLKATNLDIGVEVMIDAVVKKDGDVCVSGNLLSNLLGSFQKDEKVILETAENNLSITTKHNSSLVRTYATNDFPTIPKTSQENTFEINSNKLVEGLKGVSYAAATQEIKPEIASVLIYPENNNIVFVATDSFRLAEKKIQLEKCSFEPVLIPQRNVIEIIRIFENLNEKIKVGISKNQISFFGSWVYVTSRTTDGVFPDYKQIMTKTFKTETILLKNDLITSLKTANVFLDRLNQIQLRIFIDDSMIEMETKNQDLGENVTKIDAKLSGEDAEISFNHRYLADCLQSISEDSVTLRLNGVGKPLIVTGVGNATFTYLIMPMNR